MAALIDLSVLIAAERGQLEIADLAARYAEEGVAISAVTASELLHGVYRAMRVTQRHRRQAFVEGLIAQLPVVAFDLALARLHASLWAGLAKRGIAVGERNCQGLRGRHARGTKFSQDSRTQGPATMTRELNQS